MTVHIDPEMEKALRDWDGTPIVKAPQEVLDYWATFIPRFHICAYGPIPFGQTEPVHLSIDDLIVPGAEDAIEVMIDYIQHMCEVWRYEYDEDDWQMHAPVMLGPAN